MPSDPFARICMVVEILEKTVASCTKLLGTLDSTALV
jgi:hypothetical protein